MYWETELDLKYIWNTRGDNSRVLTQKKSRAVSAYWKELAIPDSLVEPPTATV